MGNCLSPSGPQRASAPQAIAEGKGKPRSGASGSGAPGAPGASGSGSGVGGGTQRRAGRFEVSPCQPTAGRRPNRRPPAHVLCALGQHSDRAHGPAPPPIGGRSADSPIRAGRPCPPACRPRESGPCPAAPCPPCTHAAPAAPAPPCRPSPGRLQGPSRGGREGRMGQLSLSGSACCLSATCHGAP
jgi:hypothetical protein